MKPADKMVCLEDMCPEPIQRYLAEKQQLKHVKTYEQAKDAIDQHFYEERPWNRPARARANAVTAPAEATVDAPESDELPEEANASLQAFVAAVTPAGQSSELAGDILAIVRNKFKGKG